MPPKSNKQRGPTPLFTDRQATARYVLAERPIDLPLASTLQAQQGDLTNQLKSFGTPVIASPIHPRLAMGLPPSPIPKPVRDRFYASIVENNERDLKTILRDHDCRELVNYCDEQSTGTDGWRYLGFTPCHYACKFNHSEILRILVENGGSDPNIPNVTDFGRTALMVAAEEGNDECIRVLLETTETTVDIDAVDVYNKTALFIAAAGGHVECLEALLGHGCKVNVRDHQGMTALHAAARSAENEEALRLLCLTNGIDLNRPCKAGHTPLDLTPADSVNAEILRAAGAKPTADEDDLLDLYEAAHCLDHPLIERLLKTKECRGVVNKPDQRFTNWCVKGYTALQYAADAGNVRGLSLLLGMGGADPDARGDSVEGNPALLLACIRGHTVLLEDMLFGKHTAPLVNIHAVNRQGHSAVFVAVANNRRECLQLLLRREQMDPNRPENDTGMTPLHVACKFGFQVCAQMLLGAGCWVNPRDEEGHTPLSYASQQSLRRMLAKEGAL